MVDFDGLTKVKLRTAQERCEALLQTLRSYEARVLPSPATRSVVAAINVAVESLRAKLLGFSSNPDLPFLTASEIEAKIHKQSQFLPYFHYFLGLIEPSDVDVVRAELAAPLRRITKDLFGGTADLIVVSSFALNYSITEISGDLRKILESLDCHALQELPDKVFLASIPCVEYDQALLHCILAHELGHPVYQNSDIETGILASITIDKAFLRSLFSSRARSAPKHEKQQTEFPYEQILYESKIADEVSKAIPSWIQELCADLFGLLIFGPAYLLSLIHFSSSFLLLESASASHPPSRLRLKLLFKLLRRRFTEQGFSPSTREFLAEWEQIASIPINVENDVARIAFHSIQDETVLNKLLDVVEQVNLATGKYDQIKYDNDVKALGPMINALIPPVEVLADDGTGLELSSTVGLMNAGWEVYLSGLTEFKKNLPEREALSEFKVALRYNKFLLKSLELIEVRRSWEEANDLIDRENPSVGI